MEADSCHLDVPGFAGWERRVLEPVRELRGMDETGVPENEHRWLGTNAPGGSRWYDFDPAGYLEGAAAGTFGGWEPEDGGQVVVPGPVAVLGEDGAVTSVDPLEIDSPVHPLGEVTWEVFTELPGQRAGDE